MRNTVIHLLTVIPALAASLAVNASETNGVMVSTVSYSDVAFYPEHSTSAEVIALHDSTISAEISAVVTEIIHDTGSKVSVGDAVITLDCRTYELNLQKAKAAHDAAQASYNNAKKLFASAKKLQKQNNISKELYNQREADANRFKAETVSAKADINNAKISVENCTIKAPFDGYVSARHVSKGELTQTGSPLFDMVASDSGHVEAAINNFEYQSFLNGSGFRFLFNRNDYALYVDSILPVMDKNFRTHTARLSFVDDRAPSGSHGELKWKDTQLALPSRLVVTRNNQAGILIANSNKAKFVPIENYTEGHPAFIELPPDTRIITNGRHGLKHDDDIRL